MQRHEESDWQIDSLPRLLQLAKTLTLPLAFELFALLLSDRVLRL